MAYFNILPNDILFIILTKLDYHSTLNLVKSSGVIKVVYEDSNRWKYILIKEYPDIYEIFSNVKSLPREHKIVYYYYKYNIDNFRLLLDESSDGIIGSKSKNRLCSYPRILRKLWLRSAYPYAYDLLVSIAGDDNIDYDQFVTESSGQNKWYDMLSGIKIVEITPKLYPDRNKAIEYLRTGEYDQGHIFSRQVYVFHWMLMIDTNISTRVDQYTLRAFQIGVSLKHVEGIKICLERAPIEFIIELYNVYNLPTINDKFKRNLLIRHVTSTL